MRTVGEILQRRRQELDKNLVQLAKHLKIKAEYLTALEKDDYRIIPGGVPIITGVLTNYSRALKLDPVKMSAIFRRDYVVGPRSVLPNGLSEKTFTWTPTHTVAVIVFILIFLTGVFYYSRSFFLGGSPALKLDVPKEGELIIGNSVIVKGRLKRGDIVVVNGDKVLLKADNSFETLIDCRPGDNVILVEASNPGGDKEQLTRRFICQEP